MATGVKKPHASPLTQVALSQVALSQVALSSGFADQHHLARVFRRVTGLTPSSYRRSL
jgi:AraC-like DNA-binding protein